MWTIVLVTSDFLIRARGWLNFVMIRSGILGDNSRFKRNLVEFSNSPNDILMIKVKVLKGEKKNLVIQTSMIILGLAFCTSRLGLNMKATLN